MNKPRDAPVTDWEPGRPWGDIPDEMLRSMALHLAETTSDIKDDEERKEKIDELLMIMGLKEDPESLGITNVRNWRDKKEKG